MERKHGPYAVVVGVVQQDVAEQRKQAKQVKRAPCRRRLRQRLAVVGMAVIGGQASLRAAHPYAMHYVTAGHHQGCFDRDAGKRVGDAAVMLEAFDRTAQAPKRIDVR